MLMVNQNNEKKSMELKTAHGILEVKAFDNPTYPAFDIGFKLNGHENEPAIPLVIVEDAAGNAITEKNAVVIRIYGNCNADEYTDKADIPVKDIEKFYEED